MPTVLLRLAGPMQSWGTTSRFDRRETDLEPSKSGVLGLVCAALGRDRAAPVDDLAALRFGVRADRPGVLRYDYQTAQNIVRADGTPGASAQSWRFYLADGVFLAGLEGDNRTLLEQVHAALRNPVWPLFLGRKGYVPSPGVYLEDGLCDEGLVTVLRTRRALGQRERGSGDAATRACRIVLENQESTEGALRMDQPLAPFAARRFGARYVTVEVQDVPESVDA